MGRLEVRVVGAKNLPNDQVVSMPDPYVLLTLENSTHRTSMVENTTEPEWNELFKFQVADATSAQLKLEVWNKNVVSDDFLGKYDLSLAGLYKGEERDEWYLLKQCKSNAELRVKVLAVDFGEERPPPPPPQPQPQPQPAVPPMPPQQPPMQPQQQYVPPPPPARYQQPQWGNETSSLQNQKNGLEKVVGLAKSAAGYVATAVAPGAPKDNPRYIDDASGFMYLQLDRQLRLIPSEDVFERLFNKKPIPAEFNHFSPANPPALRIGHPLPPDAALIKAEDANVYLRDAVSGMGPTPMPVRRMVDNSSWAYYGFGTGANIISISLADLQAMQESGPVFAPTA